MDLFNFAWNYLSFIIARFYGIKVAIIAGICPNTVIARSRHDFVAIHKENIRIAGIVYDSVESPCDSAVYGIFAFSGLLHILANVRKDGRK